MTSTSGESSVTAGWDVRSASARGASHLRSGTPNQDAVATYRSADGTLGIACLADGHGSKRSFRSDIGAALAVEVAVSALRRLMERYGAEAEQLDSELTQLPAAILSAWRARIAEHVAAHPVRPAEIEAAGLRETSAEALVVAYGSTLLAVAVTPHLGLVSQLGDGDIVWHLDGNDERPFESEAQYGPETVSLASGSLALTDWRLRLVRWDEPAAVVMLSTDGYANSYPDERSFLELFAKLRTDISAHGIDRVAESLPSWLRDTSRDGSGDDISVALLVRTTAPAAATGAGAHQRGAAEPRARSGSTNLALLMRVLTAAVLLMVGALAGWAAGTAGWGTADASPSGTPVITSPSPATDAEPADEGPGGLIVSPTPPGQRPASTR